MRFLQTIFFALLIVATMGVQKSLADVFAHNVRVTQEGTKGVFDGRFSDGTGAAIRFVLSDHADSVLVRIKSGVTVVRTIKGTNFPMGDTSLVWNGKDDNGADVAVGDYGVEVVTYDAGHGTYTELFFQGYGGLSTRGVATVTNPALKNFGFSYSVDNAGFQGAVGAVRYAANMQPWGNVKDSAKLTTTGIALGPGEARFSSTADKDGYVYVLARTAKQVLRYHTDSLNVVLVDTGYGAYYPFGMSINEEQNGKTIALVVNDQSGTATISANSKILSYHISAAYKTNLAGGAPKDTIVKNSGVNFWDVTWGRDSVLYATFIYPGDNPRPGIARFDLVGKTLPITLADTTWTVRADSGRVSTCTYYRGAASDGSQDILYFLEARIASGNPPTGQSIYAVTNLNNAQPTKAEAYHDPTNNATTVRSDISLDAVGNIVYFENSNEEVSLVSPPTGPNNFTTPTSAKIKVFNSEPISAVRVDANADYQPDRLSQTVTVVGIINSVNPTASSNRFEYFIQDGTGGITITKGSETGGGPVFNIGDRVAATGTVNYFRGLTEVDIPDLSTGLLLLDTGNPLTPVDVTIPQLLANAEFYEATLVRISGVAKTASSPAWPASGADANMVIWDGFTSLVLRIDHDAATINGSAEPVWPVNIVGTITQFTSSVSVHNDGYQISPNRRTDFTEGVQVPPNPHFMMVTPANNGTVTLNDSAQQVVFNWNRALDFNNDPLIYQWIPVGGTAIVTGSSGADSFLVRTGWQMAYYLSGKDTANFKWTVKTKDTPNPIVSNVDTFTVKIVRGTLTTGVGEFAALPTEFDLAQNYPNPFNPSTTIRIALPMASSLTLKVYNMLGQEVSTIYEGLQNPGYVNLTWNGKDRNGHSVASGVYFYRVVAHSFDGERSFQSIKKMLLLK